MKLYSWNVNGLRACYKKGFLDWFASEKADVVCLQETKAQITQLEEELIHPEGYHSYFSSAQKKGYSGVVTYTKEEPLKVTYGLGSSEFDSEGRVVQTEFKDFVLINAYFPNSGEEGKRLSYKLKFCKKMLATCNEIRKSGKNLVLCGDYNIAHKEIDLKNPKSNKKTSGFLPEERAWMDEFIGEGGGYVDPFRNKYNDEPDHYTWWSYRAGARPRNVGWRIDYHCVNPEFADRIKAVGHQPEVMGSDHCPVWLEVQN